MCVCKGVSLSLLQKSNPNYTKEGKVTVTHLPSVMENVLSNKTNNVSKQLQAKRRCINFIYRYISPGLISEKHCNRIQLQRAETCVSRCVYVCDGSDWWKVTRIHSNDSPQNKDT